MKNKYHGLAGLIFSGLTLFSMLGYGVYLANKMTGSIHISGPAVVPDIKVPEKSTLLYIDFLMPHITDLATLNQKDVMVDLKLFGFDPSMSSQSNITKSRDVLQENSQEYKEKISLSYALTLCFASLKNNFCVIDGTLYKANAILPDGAKILKIENDRVFILKHHKKQWIYPLIQPDVSKEKVEEAI
ncbi:MAG: hypothetical protein KKE44_04195 [Proteobacteria bacterium]|nr:hypothetical protein [Pseudomonadota bacterium]MBU1581931.1 hypothetical protein [Pseudomonadota bacterium]